MVSDSYIFIIIIFGNKEGIVSYECPTHIKRSPSVGGYFISYRSSNNGAVVFAKKMLQTNPIDFTGTINFYSCNFNNNFANNGGVIDIEFQSIALFDSCIFVNNSAKDTTISLRELSASVSNLYSKRKRILNEAKRNLITTVHKAGVMMISNYSKIYSLNCTFINNTADQSSVFHVIIVASIIVNNSVIQSNTVLDKGINGTTFQEASICTFTNSLGNVFNNTQIIVNLPNGAQGNSITSVQSGISFNNSTFTGNYSQVNYQNLNILLSNLAINNCTFQRSQLNSSLTADSLGMVETQNGGFIYSVESSIMVIHTNFINGVAKNGGSMFVSYDNNATIINCNFINSTASELGGANYFSNNKQISIVNSQTYNCNSPLGSELYLDSSSQNTTILNSQFSNLNPSNRAYIQYEKILIENCSFGESPV